MDYISLIHTKGATMTNKTCNYCGKRLRSVVLLELDQRINAYHDFGGVPENQSQGWFDFGPDCAKKLREEARKAIQTLEAV